MAEQIIEVKDEIEIAKKHYKKHYKKHVEYLVKRYKDDETFRELCKQRAKQNYLKKKDNPEFRDRMRKNALARHTRLRAEKSDKLEKKNIGNELKLDIENI